IRLAVVLDAHWKVLARLLSQPALAEDPEYAVRTNRFHRRTEVNALIASWCATRSVDEILTLFVKAWLAAATIHTYAQAARDPHVLARDMLQETRQADGSSIPITGPAAKFSRTPTWVRSGASALGANDEEILRSLGFSAADIARLREKGVITRPKQ